MLKPFSEQDHYQVLEIDYGATTEEIKAAYERARRLYGNDSLVSTTILTPEERSRMLQRCAEAYNTLVAEESRRLYDRSLAERVPRLRERMRDAAAVPPEAPQATASASKSYPRLVRAAPARGARPGAVPPLGYKEEATGEYLRRARESLGLDLRAIAEETKIGVTMLGYIEDERVDRLPAPVYLRSFVAQYARCLGLDEEKVARTYLARIRRLEAKTGR